MAPLLGENDDDGGGAQKTKGGKQRRNYDGMNREKDEELRELTWDWVCTATVPTIRHIPKGARQTWSEVLEGRVKKVQENGTASDRKEKTKKGRNPTETGCGRRQRKTHKKAGA